MGYQIDQLEKHNQIKSVTCTVDCPQKINFEKSKMYGYLLMQGGKTNSHANFQPDLPRQIDLAASQRFRPTRSPPTATRTMKKLSDHQMLKISLTNMAIPCIFCKYNVLCLFGKNLTLFSECRFIYNYIGNASQAVAVISPDLKSIIPSSSLIGSLFGVPS